MFVVAVCCYLFVVFDCCCDCTCLRIGVVRC